MHCVYETWECILTLEILVSFGSEMGQWGAIYRSKIKIVIPGGKFETSRKNK